MTTELPTKIRRRSVRLAPEEIISLKKLHKKYPTQTEVAELIGISREVLNRVMLVKSGSSETIEKIRTTLEVTNNNNN